MNYKLVVDTGPLVALLDEDDQYHRFVLERLSELPKDWSTCEAVVVETLFILRKHPLGVQKLGQMLKSFLKLNFSVSHEIDSLFRLMHTYQNLPISFADACLVRMMEKESNAVLFTLDKHFEVYRYKGRRQIPLVFLPSQKNR